MENEYTGCRLSKKDIRDYKIKASSVEVDNLPKEFILKLNQQIKNQSPINSCVAHAASSILEFHSDNPKELLSTNFIYGFQEDYQPGMFLRDACDILKKYGDCTLNIFPGNYEHPQTHIEFQKIFNNLQSYDNSIEAYYDCPDDNAIKYALYNYGPVLAALNWPHKSTVSNNGDLIFSSKMLKNNYHAIMIYGYDNDGFWCLNSYGEKWGLNGSFHIKYTDNLIGEAKAIIYRSDKVKQEQDINLYKTKASSSNSINFIYKQINKIKNIFNR